MANNNNTILINKRSGSIYNEYTFDVDTNELKKNYSEKINNDINELSSEDSTLYLDKEGNLTNQELIEQFLSDYTIVNKKMTDEQLIDFYETVRGDLPLSYFQADKQKLNVLDIDFSQAVLITNQNNKINGRNFVNLNQKEFNDEHTYTCWIKPLSKNYKRKTLIRQNLIFNVEGTQQRKEREHEEEIERNLLR